MVKFFFRESNKKEVDVEDDEPEKGASEKGERKRHLFPITRDPFPFHNWFSSGFSAAFRAKLRRKSVA